MLLFWQQSGADCTNKRIHRRHQPVSNNCYFQCVGKYGKGQGEHHFTDGSETENIKIQIFTTCRARCICETLKSLKSKFLKNVTLIFDLDINS